MTNAIVTENIRKTYRTKQGDVEALKGISFDISHGELVGLIGNNGAGKSTTLNILVGLIDASLGSSDIYLKRAKSTIWDTTSYVPEENVLPPQLTGIEFCKLMYMLRFNRSISRKEISRRLNEQGLLDTKVLSKAIATYSKGTKRLLGVAESLLNAPELVILDEPFEGLDPHNQSLLETTIKKYNSEYGVTFFVSTHSIEKVKSMCDRVIFLKQGTIAFDGDADEIRSAPEKLLALYKDPS